MALTSLQVCMDSSDWLQGTVNDQENGMDSSSPSGGDNILMCSRPLIERRLRPPHDQALKCPRCDSTHTKFCYYNNYSLSQPRYFCKTCRRYWTKGGTLRNIPVGGGCRKNKKVSNSKKSSSSDNNIAYASVIAASSTDLHLSSPDMQFSHLNTLLAADHHHGSSHGNGSTTSFIDSKYNAFLGTNTARPIDQFLNHNFMGGDHLGIMSSNVVNDHHYQTFQENAGGTTFNTNSTTTTTPLYGGMSLDGNNINSYHGAFIDTCQRLMLPNYEDDDQNDGIEVKPNTKLLALEWQQQADDQSCGDDHLSVKDHNQHSFGYVNAGTLGSWNGLMNGYGSSATNPSLV